MLGVFYAFGFAAGNVIGIMAEKQLALGYTNFLMITSKFAIEITTLLRESCFAVTAFEGDGKDGKVTEIYFVSEKTSVIN